MRHINLHVTRPKLAHLLLTLLVSAIFAVLVLPPVPASAHDGHGGPDGHLHAAPDPDDVTDTPTYTVTDNPDCAEQDKLSLDWDFNNDGCTNTSDLITITFRLLAGIVGIAVVGGITWGGMLYASSNGNASKAQQGITVIVNAVIGLLLFIFMFAITNFLVPGGVIG